jgi:hypothetical protein
MLKNKSEILLSVVMKSDEQSGPKFHWTILILHEPRREVTA